MNYPLISQYVEAIVDAENSLDKLRHLRPVMDKYGSPTRSSGAFAVVFKMEDPGTGKLYALKCFTEEQRGRAEAYRAISEELQYARGRYFTSMKYYKDELFVDTDSDDTTFPVLLMDWVEGETMESYIAKHYNDTYAMSMLTYEFCKMASWLRSQPFAHGDIKPDNIIVREDGTLTLIDYDGMFVPSMEGQKSPTLGTANFRHPKRTINDFNETIDDFTLASMALSLKAISLKPELAIKYGTTDKLLFSEADYKNLGDSNVMRELLDIISDEELSLLYSLFMLSYSEKNLLSVSFRKFLIKKNVFSEELTGAAFLERNGKILIRKKPSGYAYFISLDTDALYKNGYISDNAYAIILEKMKEKDANLENIISSFLDFAVVHYEDSETGELKTCPTLMPKLTRRR